MAMNIERLYSLSVILSFCSLNVALDKRIFGVITTTPGSQAKENNLEAPMPLLGITSRYHGCLPRIRKAGFPASRR